MAKKQPRSVSKPVSFTAASTETAVSKPYRTIALCLAGLAFCVYLNTLGHDYVLDDPLAIGANELVVKGFSAWPDLLTTHYRFGAERATASVLLYRPLSLMAFAAEWAIAPNKPGFGHFMNILWYALATGMVFLALRRLFAGYHWLWAAGAACLFAVHPLHTEVVANIKSRDDIMSVFFGMAALYFFARRMSEATDKKWLYFSVTAYFLALLSKESAITLLPVFGLSAWFFGQKDAKSSITSTLPYLIPIALFFILQRIAFSGVKATIVIDPMDNPIVDASGFAERTATGFAVMWQYIQLLVVPHPLLCDYSYNHFPVVNWGNWQAWAGLTVIGGMIGFGFWGLSRKQPLAFLAAAFLCGMVLYSQLILVIGTLFGERLTFAPSVWWCAGIVFLLLKVLKIDLKQSTEGLELPQNGRLSVGIIASISLVFAILTWVRNADWHDNLALFKADSAKAPNSIRMHNGVANELYRSWQTNQEQFDEAAKNKLMDEVERETRLAMAVKNNPVSYLNLGNIATVKKQYALAVEQYELSLKESPGFKLAQQNLAQICVLLARKEGQENNNLPRAEQLLQRAIDLGDTSEDTYMNMGAVLGMQGKNAAAIPFFEGATKKNPANKTAWRNLAMAYNATGNAVKAAEAAARAQ